MIHVYVWLPVNRGWGHASMYVERDDPSESRYVSWWPRDYNNAWPLLAHWADLKTYAQDVALEGRNPTVEFTVNLGIEFLNEGAMISAWDRWKTTRFVYFALERNCCTVVAKLIRGPGGGASHDWEPVTWWAPEDIVQYMSLLARDTVMAVGQVTRPPPNIT